MFLLHFALAMTIVNLTANVIATMMATALAMISHRLFYDSYKTIVAIIFFFFIRAPHGARAYP
jgi:hypothetical protein